jgi:uncharacterized membrane protein
MKDGIGVFVTSSLTPLAIFFNIDVYTLILIVYVVLTIITSLWMYSVTGNISLSSSWMIVMFIVGGFSGLIQFSFLFWAVPMVIVLCAGYYFMSRDGDGIKIEKSKNFLLDDVSASRKNSLQDMSVTVAFPSMEEKGIEKREISSKLGGALKGIRRN